MNKRRAIGVLVFMVFTIGETPLFSGSSNIPFQGFLVDSEGNPLDGAPQVTFKMSDCTSGETLWDEVQTVTITEGTFDTKLGSVDSFPAGLFDHELCLAMEIEGETLTSEISSVPRALFAEEAALADVATTALALSSTNVGTGLSVSSAGVLTLNTGTSNTWSGTTTFTGNVAVNSTTITPTEFSRLDGRDAALIDANDTDVVLEAHLKAVDAPADEECLTYEATGGDFEWQSCGLSSIGADSLNFIDLADALALDASTSITADGAEVLTITNTGTGNSLVVQDAASDTTPFVINASGSVGIGTTTPQTPLNVQGGSIQAGTTAGNYQEITGGDNGIRHRWVNDAAASFRFWLAANADTALGLTGFDGGALRLATSTGRHVTFYVRNGDADPDGIGILRAGNTNMMAFDPTRGVGIGTIFPNLNLDVRATSAVVAQFDRVTDDGTIINLAQDGTVEGTISVAGNTISYNAFTGSHYAETTGAIERGMLVALTGENSRLHGNPHSEIIYGVGRSTEANDPKIMGAYLGIQEPSEPQGPANPHLVMAVGNGEILTVDTGRDLEPGDTLISSMVPGHAMVDPGTYPVSHVIAKVAEPVDWGKVTETVDHKGISRRHKLVSVFFTSFLRDNELETIVERQGREIEELKQKQEALEAALETLFNLEFNR